MRTFEEWYHLVETGLVYPNKACLSLIYVSFMNGLFASSGSFSVKFNSYNVILPCTDRLFFKNSYR